MTTAQRRFEQLRARWRTAAEKASEMRFTLQRNYGSTWYVYAPQGKRDRMERAQKAEDRAAEAIFAWLDANSPRNWRSGVPAKWVCESLTYADAITTEKLSVIPPPAYGCYPSDSVRFAAAVSVAV